MCVVCVCVYAILCVGRSVCVKEREGERERERELARTEIANLYASTYTESSNNIDYHVIRHLGGLIN